jgi:hypothetical protein
MLCGSVFQSGQVVRVNLAGSQRFSETGISHFRDQAETGGHALEDYAIGGVLFSIYILNQIGRLKNERHSPAARSLGHFGG